MKVPSTESRNDEVTMPPVHHAITTDVGSRSARRVAARAALMAVLREVVVVAAQPTRTATTQAD